MRVIGLGILYFNSAGYRVYSLSSGAHWITTVKLNIELALDYPSIVIT